jgi:ribonuclease G
MTPSEDILINITPQETRVAVVAQGIAQELHVERTSLRGLVGNIYLGKVVRVLPGMQSAFIDAGLDRAAFLHVADIWRHEAHRESPLRDGMPDERSPAQALAKPGTNGHHEPIERILHEGQSLLVQVVKDPLGTKGARLSTQMSIAGRLLVYLPQEPRPGHIGVSQRIGDEADREQLRTRVLRLVGTDEAGGYIVRTLAEDASDEDLAADITYLRKLWDDIVARSRTARAPSLLYQDLGLAERMLRDFAGDATGSILVDSRESYERLMDFARAYTPKIAPRITHYGGDRPLFERHGIDAEIERAMARRVDLKSGGYLIIDQTEAMTTIDVNTGGFVGGRSFDDTIFKTNLEAAQAIARQLRLRNLGGIIVLDFIDMQTDEHRDTVLAELRRALAGDRMKITVNGFTQLGLVEMTRKRTRESLAHVLCETCPTCHGTGQIKTARTVCYEILRDVLREARQFNPREFRVLAAQSVIDLFLEEESQSLAALGDFIGKSISLNVESLYMQEQYDVILM